MNIAKYELIVIFAVLILTVSEWPRHPNLPVLLKVAHFFFVALFSLVGVAGLSVLIALCLNYEAFMEMLFNHIPQKLERLPVRMLVVAFSLVGSFFFFGALRLGRFKNWGRKAVLVFAIPYSLMYPIMVTILVGEARSTAATKVILFMALILVSFSIMAIIMYTSKRFSGYVVFE